MTDLKVQVSIKDESYQYLSDVIGTYIIDPSKIINEELVIILPDESAYRIDISDFLK